MLSRDEKTLYVNDTAGESMLAFDVAADGATSKRRTFAKYPNVTTGAGGASTGRRRPGHRSQGRLYCAANGGVQVFSTTGERLGTIPVSLPPQNLAFAGPDKQTLYIVGRGSAFKVRMLARGFAGRSK